MQANYSKVANLRDICKLRSETLEKDLRGASEFVSRFRILNADYDTRISCGNKIAQSLKDLTLPDLNPSPNISKSMSESFRRDMSRVSEVEAQVVAKMTDKRKGSASLAPSLSFPPMRGKCQPAAMEGWQGTSNAEMWHKRGLPR